MNPTFLAQVWAYIRSALVAEDTEYWGRAPTEPHIPRGLAEWACYAEDEGTIVVHWSQEYGLGPRDYPRHRGAPLEVWRLHRSDALSWRILRPHHGAPPTLHGVVT